MKDNPAKDQQSIKQSARVPTPERPKTQAKNQYR